MENKEKGKEEIENKEKGKEERAENVIQAVISTLHNHNSSDNMLLHLIHTFDNAIKNL